MTDTNNSLLPAQQKQLPAVSPGMATELQRVVNEGRDRLIWIEQHPRNEVTALAEIKKLCQNKRIAEQAEYALPVGGTKIKGPTIHLMKAIASKWGRIDFGWTELYSSDHETCGRVYARDLVTEAQAAETLTIKHVRYSKTDGFQPIKDPDSIYRHVMQRVSKRLRECLKSVIPPHIVEEALEVCKATLADGTDLQSTLAKMLKAFESDFGIGTPMLEIYLKRSVTRLDAGDIDGLRSLHRALREGETTVEEVFGIMEGEVVEEAPKSPLSVSKQSSDSMDTEPAASDTATADVTATAAEVDTDTKTDQATATKTKTKKPKAEPERTQLMEDLNPATIAEDVF